jgi:hypothetical protein
MVFRVEIEPQAFEDIDSIAEYSRRMMDQTHFNLRAAPSLG